MWSDRRSPATDRAAALSTDWSLSRLAGRPSSVALP